MYEEPDRRYHLHCDGCGKVTFHPSPVLAPEKCPLCGSRYIACDDSETGIDVSRSGQWRPPEGW